MGLMILARGNDALDINPPVGVQHLTVAGSDWLWAVCAVYAVCFLGVLAHTRFARNGEYVFHYLFTISLLVGTIAYFAMASDLGAAAITPVDHTNNATDAGTREIFWVKYVNWFIGWTPSVIALGLISGVSWATILFNIALTWTFTVCLLVSAVVESTYKWGFFTFGLCAVFVLAASLFTHGLAGAKRVGTGSSYTLLAGWTVFLWVINYPIAFGISDGGNLISVTDTFVYFGILDILYIPILSVAFIFLSNKFDYAALNLYFTQYGRVAQQAGTFPEKHVTPANPEAPVDEPAAATPAV